jgi:hypothetical protein
VEHERNRGLGYWGTLALIILVIVIGIGVLYAYRAFQHGFFQPV